MERRAVLGPRTLDILQWRGFSRALLCSLLNTNPQTGGICSPFLVALLTQSHVSSSLATLPPANMEVRKPL